MYFEKSSEEAPHGLLSWRFTLDNPNFLGWTVVAAYFAAAACCIRAGLKSRNNSQTPLLGLWWLFAVVLVMLGINKQLNLQTLMIVIGRIIFNAAGWYGARRQAQLVFTVAFSAFSFGALVLLWRYCGAFFRQNQLVLAGAIVLVLFVVMRAASINHAVALRLFNFNDDQWAWILEISGSLLIAAGALRRTAGHRLE
jgi:hypothetical protein